MECSVTTTSSKLKVENSSFLFSPKPNQIWSPMSLLAFKLPCLFREVHTQALNALKLRKNHKYSGIFRISPYFVRQTIYSHGKSSKKSI